MLPIAHASAPLLALAVYNKIKKVKNGEKIPSFWFIVIGIAGILPDLLKPHLSASERLGISHSIFFPLFFLGFYLVLKSFKNKYGIYFLLFFWGTLLHLILDMVTGVVFLFYPLNYFTLNEVIFFPANIIKLNDGRWYADFYQHALWYLFDAFFFGLYVFIDKTDFFDKILGKIFKKKA
jgi:hypothetical protein